MRSLKGKREEKGVGREETYTLQLYIYLPVRDSIILENIYKQNLFIRCWTLIKKIKPKHRIILLFSEKRGKKVKLNLTEAIKDGR